VSSQLITRPTKTGEQRLLRLAIFVESQQLLHHQTPLKLPTHRERQLASMATSSLPPIAGLPSLSASERAQVLDLLFEPCTQLHTLSVELLGRTSFDNYGALIAAVGLQLTELAESASTSDTEWLESILGAHPRLGEKKIDSAQSRAEQAQLHDGQAEEAAQLKALNEEYERAYPGLRYV
jgi:hypothetical protein